MAYHVVPSVVFGVVCVLSLVFWWIGMLFALYVWCGIALFGIVYVEGSSVAMCCICVIACFARIDWVVMYGMWVVVFVFLSLIGWVVRRKRMSGASWYL